MKVFKRAVKFCVCLWALIGLLASSALASSSYKTYTYSYNGDILESPDAFVFDRNITGEDLGISPLNNPNDVFGGPDGRVYIADTGANRILVLSGNFELEKEITGFINPDTGAADTFNAPKGVFVTDGGELYVADSLNKRLVVLKTADGSCQRVLEEPESPLLSGYAYTPESVVVDSVGRIYVVTTSINVGVVALDKDGSFSGFLGAKRVTPSFTELVWRYFMTDEQKENSTKIIPSSYNNVAIDDQGFLYLTTSSYEDWELESYAYYRTGNDQYAPVRRLNATGLDVLTRNGFYPPMGDIEFSIGHLPENGASRMIDVALDKNGVYSLLDQKRGKIFTYDETGNLLYAFGGIGSQDGLVGAPASLSYHGDKLLVLDSTYGRVVVYTRTAYGRLVDEAIELGARRKYSEAAAKWEDVAKLNNNNEIVYSSMGMNYMTAEKYEEAMDCFYKYKDVSNYSLAYEQVRKSALRVWALPLVIGVILLVILLVKLSAKARAYNRAGQEAGLKQTVGRQLIYSQHILFHPFDGFYDMKRENRGSVAAATVLLLITTLTFIAKDLFTGFIFSGGWGTEKTVWESIVGSAMTVLLPVLLWCASNWCLTTLMNGEGKMSHIYMATAYSLVPLAIVNVPIIILSNVLTLNEGAFITFLSAIGTVWTVLLLFIGVLTIHNYTLPKNIITILLTLVGIAIILFISLLFFNVVQKMAAFLYNLWTEISFRL